MTNIGIFLLCMLVFAGVGYFTWAVLKNVIVNFGSKRQRKMVYLIVAILLLFFGYYNDWFSTLFTQPRRNEALSYGILTGLLLGFYAAEDKYTQKNGQTEYNTEK